MKIEIRNQHNRYDFLGTDRATPTEIKKHLERASSEKDGSMDIIIVEDGVVDNHKLIQSELKNAGLLNILKHEEMLYGTIQNAELKNKARQFFADVSNYPDSVSEQRAYVEAQNKKLQDLALSLGVSVDEVLAMTEATYNQLISNKAKQNEEGGAE